MIDLRKLEILYAVAQAGSFSAAADQLYLTQSAVSQHMKELETSLGTQLFNRGQRGVSLTPSAEQLVDYTRQIFRLLREAEASIMDVANIPSGQLRIGATPGVSVYLLPQWMRSFRSLYPHLTLALSTDVTSGIAVGVRQGQLELGFIEGELEADPALQQYALQEFQQAVIVGKGHPWCGRESIQLQDLTEQSLIVRPTGSHTRSWLDQLLHENNIHVRIVAELDNADAIKQAVIAGMGVAILPEYAVQHEAQSKLLQIVMVEDVPMQRTLKLVWNDDIPFNAISRTFLLHIAEHFPQIHRLFDA